MVRLTDAVVRNWNQKDCPTVLANPKRFAYRMDSLFFMNTCRCEQRTLVYTFQGKYFYVLRRHALSNETFSIWLWKRDAEDGS